MKGIISLALLMALLPSAATAQTGWDIAPFAGLLLGRVDIPDEGGYQEDWFEAAQGGLALGRYLSPHLKLQLEGSATTQGTRFLTRPSVGPGLPNPYWITSEERVTVQSVAATVVWQFRDNEWIHPFVDVGLSVDRDHRVLFTPEQFVFGDTRGTPLRVVDSRTEEKVSWRARPLVGGGAKLYFREHAFVRTDARLAVDGGRQHLACRVGVGVDF